MRKEKAQKGATMLQENSFFFRPTTYFGTYQNAQEEDEIEEEELNFDDPWRIFLEANTSTLLQQRIGLFLHWHDVNE